MTSEGFDNKAKQEVINNLRRLLKHLRKAQLIRGQACVTSARVPIVKCLSRYGFSVDISMGTANNAAAVCLIRNQMSLAPPLRPLMLILRAILKMHNLGEPSLGGLSSYPLTWAIVAHLMQEGFKVADPARARQQPPPANALPPPRLLKTSPNGPSMDLGSLLHGFLRRFSPSNFNSSALAVSVLQGGFTSKPPAWNKSKQGKEKKPQKHLSVEDPLKPGQDAACASFKFEQMRWKQPTRCPIPKTRPGLVAHPSMSSSQSFQKS
ncbi:hypothetical protein WJX73_008912 [Symbiochloris irregularis]|uniref:Uncharacterized protein n=1 Tax=Symbiochloris irregularis TaxID=706552 RepID=A0AAW1PG00_9CHLO